jgi:CDP-2,3-bis-(O-geranylgeranyl)-sn-glycerol synthase
MELELELLLILITANGTPILLRRYLGSSFSQPIDGGLILSDGHPLFGCSKTWRGLFSGLSATAILAFIIDFPVLFAVPFALLSLLGDLFSSFIKRRLKKPPSSKCIGLDQLPETLFPLLAGAYWFGYGLEIIVIVTLFFFLINLLSPVILSLLGIKPL